VAECSGCCARNLLRCLLEYLFVAVPTQCVAILENFTGKTLAFCHLPRKFEMCNLHMYILPRLPLKNRSRNRDS
ncbi:hypothetical protein, partial [Candidatus Uabimicrobium amorphum]|uniref:hypothetical protein n=1 Tax=Uabimicrobium amorphum TaxID=2596890 RepID=UPI0034A2143F